MKTKLTFLASLALITVFILFGCKKGQKDNVSNVKQPSISNINIVPIIKSFKLRMNSHVKTTDSVTADSAEWYLVALSNYTYGDASAQGEYQSIDSAFVSIPFSNSHIAISDMENKYDAIIDSIRLHYNSIDNSEKQLLAVDVQTIWKISNQINFKITSFILYGSFPTGNLTFGPNDWWKWWNGGCNFGGYCAGVDSGQNMASDAANQIQNKVMARKAIPTQGYCYVPPLATIELWPTDYPNPDHSGEYNYYSYYMFWNVSGQPDFHGCLCPDEMNFYLTGAEHIVYTADDDPNNPGAKPPDLSFISIIVQGDGIFPYGSSTYLHRGYAYYGTLIKRGGPPDHF